MQPVQFQCRDTQVYMMIEYYNEKGYDSYKIRKLDDGQFAILVQDSTLKKPKAPTPGAVARLHSAAIEIIHKEVEPDLKTWGVHQIELIIKHHEQAGKTRFIVSKWGDSYTVEPILPTPTPPLQEE